MNQIRINKSRKQNDKCGANPKQLVNIITDPLECSHFKCAHHDKDDILGCAKNQATVVSQTR